MMSLANLGLNWGPLVHNIFVIFLYVLKSPLLVLLRLTFSHQHKSNPKVVDLLQYCCARFEVYNFHFKFKNQYYSFPFCGLTLHLQPLFFYNMLRRASMGGIRRPSNYDSGDLYPAVFIQCVSEREPMAREFWSHKMGGICCKVHPTVRVEMANGTVE